MSDLDHRVLDRPRRPAARLVRRPDENAADRTWPAEVREMFADAPPAPRWRPWQVLGGPGTGKTSLLVDLAVHRIASGADPESVLVLTHSRRAAGPGTPARLGAPAAPPCAPRPAPAPGLRPPPSRRAAPAAREALTAGLLAHPRPPGVARAPMARATRDPLVRTIHSYAFAV